MRLDLNICLRKPFKVDLLDISKREFKLVILFLWNITHYSLNTQLKFNNTLRKQTKLLETPRSLSEYILTLITSIHMI